METQSTLRVILLLCCVILGCLSSVKAAPSLDSNGTKILWGNQPNEKWKSNVNTKYEDQGLSPWYDFAVSFINTVLNKEPYDIMRKAIRGDDLFKDPVNDYALGYALGMLIVVGIGLLFCLIMPIVGMCFCCCRLCNNCGGEMSQKESAKNACKRAVFGVILSIITLLMFAGVLLTFVCNDNMSKTIGKAKETGDGIINEAINFINKTFNEFDNIIDKDFAFVVKQFSEDISDRGVQKQLGDPLLKILEATIEAPLDEVTKMSTNSKLMESQLNIIMNNTDELKQQGEALSLGLEKAKEDIGNVLANCTAASLKFCSSINESQLSAGANFSSVPDVTKELENIKGVTGLDFEDAARKGLQTLKDIPITMINKTRNSRNEISKMIANATTSVKKMLADARKTVDDSFIIKLRDFQKLSDDYTGEGNKYDKYRWYAGIGLTCMLLLIVVLMALGLMCGICGQDKEATSTTRGSVSNMGGNCLMAATGFCFLFASLLMLLTTICFIIGAPMESIVCEPLKTNRIFSEVVDNKLSYKDNKLPLGSLLGNGNITIKIGDALENCRNNKPAYKALHIDKLYNISKKLDIKELLGDKVDKQLDDLKVNLTDQTILKNESKESLKKLNTSGVDKINFEQFTKETRKGITTTNLTTFASDLDLLAQNFSKAAAAAANATVGSIRNKLYALGNKTQQIASDLRKLDRNVAQEMKKKSVELDENVAELKKIGNDLSKQAIKALDSAEEAERKLHQDAPADITKIVTDYADRVLGWGYQFTDHVLDLVDNRLGKCKPLTNIFDGIVEFLCTGLLQPFNGFWFSIGFCLFFFIPVIIFSVKLAKHYRCMKYESEFDQDGLGSVEAFEMGQPPPAYSNPIGQEKKLWANPK